MNNPTLEYFGCAGEPAGYKTLFKPAGEGCDSHQEHLNWNYHVPSRRHVWLLLWYQSKLQIFLPQMEGLSLDCMLSVGMALFRLVFLPFIIHEEAI